MADPLLPDKLDDFVNLTNHNYVKRQKKRGWVDLSMPFQHYTFAQRFFTKHKRMEDGGDRLEWKIQTDNIGSFTDFEFYGKVETAQADLTTKAFVEWSEQLVYYTYDINEKLMQATEPVKIVDELEIRIHSMYNDWFNGMEQRMWTAPTSDSQNPRRPYGIPFWIQKGSSAAFSFQGGDPDGFSSGAGNVAVGTVDAWKNGAFRYANLTDDDGIDKWVEACDKCQFTAPHNFNQLDAGKTDWGFYTTYPNLQVLRKFLRDQNDDLGGDVAAYRGTVLFKGNPVIWVPALTDSASSAYDSTNPIYGINWRVFDFFFQKGRNQQVLRPITPHNQPTVRKVFMINIDNFKCLNRRLCFVGHTPA